MAIRRVWLDWSNPCLPAAARWLIAELPAMTGAAEARKGAGCCDLRGVLCVLPGRRAGRLLLAQLVEQCNEVGLRLVPPRVVTPGSMIEALRTRFRDHPQAIPFANSQESILAWLAALRMVPAQVAASLVPTRPADDDAATWNSLAEMVAGLYEELAGGARSFQDVAGVIERRGGSADEVARWQALEALQKLYGGVLGESGLVDPHQALSHAASRDDATAAVDAPITAVIGVVELNAVQRLALAGSAGRVVALVHAPESRAEDFDKFGCVSPDRWRTAHIDLEADQVKVAQRPDDQAHHAMHAIAGLNGRYTAAQITIGLGDDALAPALRTAAEWAGLRVRSAGGSALHASPPCRALHLIGQWLADQRFATLAAMLRHADIEQFVAHAASNRGGVGLASRAASTDSAVAEWLTILDRYFADHLHQRVTGQWLGDPQRAQGLAAVYDAIVTLSKPLMSAAGRGPRLKVLANRDPMRRPLGEWSQPILAVLASLYGDRKFTARNPMERRTADACEAVRDVLAELAAAPLKLQPLVTAAQALELLQARCAGESLPQDLDDGQIEMLGWLELHLDVAPALIIVGVNEGAIPRSHSADLFLPDSLRADLGLSCNHSRYARDAYLLEAIRRSRPHLTLIAGRRSAQGEPLTPSRLLLACDSETMLDRIEALCGERSTGAAGDAVGPVRAARASSAFAVPRLPPLDPPQRMAITEFKEYLACPYRYALRRLLRLQAFDDQATQLDAMQFGTLAHQALCAFGTDDRVNQSTDAEQIERFLVRTLDDLAQQRFGSTPMPAVRVQVARLRQRLRSFAQLQARMAAQGWRIRHCERSFDGAMALDIPGQQPMPLRGTIDRIDVNVNSGHWRIIDYKTSERARSPHQSHHNCQRLPEVAALEWIDLQLPLYHYLATGVPLRDSQPASVRGNGQEARGNGIGAPLPITHCPLPFPSRSGDVVELAYLCLPKQSQGACLHCAEWSAEHIEHGIERARQVVRDIRAGRFEMNPDATSEFDPFARICHAQVFGERAILVPGEDEEQET